MEVDQQEGAMSGDLSIRCESDASHKIQNGEEMALVKIPHRALMATCRACSEELVKDGRGRVHSTPKMNRDGVVAEFDFGA